MDGLSFHPYPNAATDPLDRGYPWPNAGFVNLARIKQARVGRVRRHRSADDASTGSVSISTRSAGRSTPPVAPGTTGAENVAVTDEESQAAVYGELVRRARLRSRRRAGERLRLP